MSVEAQTLTLSGVPEDLKQGPVIVYIQNTNNLPMSIAYQPTVETDGPSGLNATITEVHQANINLDECQKEWLK